MNPYIFIYMEFTSYPSNCIICVFLRYEIKNQTLWEEIKFVLDNFADPFTQLFQQTLKLCETHKSDIKIIPMLYESILLCTKIFHRSVARDFVYLFIVEPVYNIM